MTREQDRTETKLPLSLKRLIQSADVKLQKIDVKFSVRGYSYLLNNSDFGCVERAAKGKTIYVGYLQTDIWSWLQLDIKRGSAFFKRKRRSLFQQKDLETVKCRENMENKPVNWLKIQWLYYKRNKPYEMLHKQTLNVDLPFMILHIQTTPHRGWHSSTPLSAVHLCTFHSNHWSKWVPPSW